MRPSVVLLLLAASAPAQIRIPAEGFETLDASVENLVAQYQVPGASVAIARHGRLLTVRGYGWADVEAEEAFAPGSLSRWNSISKTVTATAILRLVEQGKVELDARVFDILDGVRPYNGAWGDARIPEITVRQLLHHTGGWDRGVSGDPLMPPRRDRAWAALGGPFPPSAETLARYTIAQPLDFQPGTRYCYSNFGYLLLGMVVERVSGESYEAFVRANVLDPIGLAPMKRALNRLDQRQAGEVLYYDYPQASPLPSVFLPGNPPTPGPYALLDFENILPVGGWLGSVVHLARFAESLDGQRPPAVMGRATFESMVAEIDRSLWAGANAWYGLGIMAQTYPAVNVWTHGGASQGSRSTFVRFSNGCSYALLVNGEGAAGGDGFRGSLANLLSRECLGSREWPDEDLFPRYLAPHARPFAAPVAPDSRAVLSGSELGPVRLRLADAAGAEHEIPLIEASLTEVTFQVPSRAAPGTAVLRILREPHPELSLPLEIAAPAAPKAHRQPACIQVRGDPASRNNLASGDSGLRTKPAACFRASF